MPKAAASRCFVVRTGCRVAPTPANPTRYRRPGGFTRPGRRNHWVQRRSIGLC